MLASETRLHIIKLECSTMYEVVCTEGKIQRFLLEWLLVIPFNCSSERGSLTCEKNENKTNKKRNRPTPFHMEIRINTADFH